jgi:hypothetical protein
MLPITTLHDLSVQVSPLLCIGSGLVYVVPATILTDSSYCIPKELSTERADEQAHHRLGEEASNGGCSLHIRRKLACGDFSQVDVSASRDVLPHHPLSIFVAEGALFTALAHNRRLKQETHVAGGVR